MQPILHIDVCVPHYMNVPNKNICVALQKKYEKYGFIFVFRNELCQRQACVVAATSNGNSNIDNKCVIDDINTIGFEFLRSYVYGEHPIIYVNNVCDVLQMAVKLDMKTIINDCDHFIRDILISNNDSTDYLTTLIDLHSKNYQVKCLISCHLIIHS